MTDQHPIVPSFELRNQWQSESPFKTISVDREDYMINRAAQWGADQELKACCDWLSNRSSLTEALRTKRRPKPPSKKEQALEALGRIDGWAVSQLKAYAIHDDLVRDVDFLRQLLEGLNND